MYVEVNKANQFLSGCALVTHSSELRQQHKYSLKLIRVETGKLQLRRFVESSFVCVQHCYCLLNVLGETGPSISNLREIISKDTQPT